MKYLTVGLFGFVLGLAAAGAVLYFDPLTGPSAPAASATDRSLHYLLPDQMLDLTLGDRALLPGMRSGGNRFWEESIAGTALLGIVLSDDLDQPTAVASRLLSGSRDTDLLLRGVLVHDYWLLTIPEEGSVFVRVDTNVWPFLKRTLLPVWYLGRPWHGPSDYHPTAGPGAESTAVVVGATGRFKGVEGSALERYRLTELDPARRVAAATGELSLHLLDSPAVTAAQ